MCLLNVVRFSNENYDTVIDYHAEQIIECLWQQGRYALNIWENLKLYNYGKECFY